MPPFPETRFAKWARHVAAFHKQTADSERAAHAQFTLCHAAGPRPVLSLFR